MENSFFWTSVSKKGFKKLSLTSEQFSVANILAIEQRATVSGCLESNATAALRTINLKEISGWLLVDTWILEICLIYLEAINLAVKSASSNWVCWNVDKVFPNCFLTFACSIACCMLACAAPKEHDAILMRPPFNPFMAILKPWIWTKPLHTFQYQIQSHKWM